VADVLIARGDYTEALFEIETGIEHTPTILELTQNKIRILRKLGRASESAAVAAELSVYDPADRNTNTIFLNALLLNGELKRGIEAAYPFSIDHKNRVKLFQTQYNRFCLRCGDCAVRANDRPTAIRFYQTVIKNFEQFRKSQFNYLGWGMKKTVSLVKVLKWADDLINDSVLARAGSSLLKLFLSVADMKAAEELALQFVSAIDTTVLALSTVYFARQGSVLPALKCFLKLGNSPARFAAGPAIAILMGNLGELPEVVQQVATELYVGVEGEPIDPTELGMAARGAFYVGDQDGAAEALRKAAVQAISFKQAVDIFGIAAFEIGNEGLAEEIERMIHQANPLYEVRIVGKYECPDLSGLQAEEE
jgi:tetratricopeptide (TPR) repeat protein